MNNIISNFIKSPGNQKRKAWIDGLRGLAMIFVLYGHFASGWTEYFVFTSAIKIPLFFAITGYVFKTRDGNFQRFVKNLAIKIGIPWIVLTLLPIKILYRMIRLDFLGAAKYLYTFISGGVYWYMPCCILAEIIFFMIVKHGKHIRSVVFLAIAVSIFGFILAALRVGCFAQFRVACIAQAFMVIGYLFRQNEQNRYFQNNERVIYICASVLYLILGIATLIFYPHQCMDVHVSRYYNLPICMGMIITGLTAVFILFRKYYKKDGVLSFVGQNTLVFYMLGAQCKSATISILTKLHFPLAKNPFVWFLLLLLVCVECAVLSCIMNRVCPLFVGKRKVK